MYKVFNHQKLLKFHGLTSSEVFHDFSLSLLTLFYLYYRSHWECKRRYCFIIVPGAKTYENQVTPYTQKWRGICIVFDSEKSPREQSMEPPKNPLYAPNLIFESRFESGNLRQARRV